MVSCGGVSRPSASKSLKNPRPTVPAAARSLTRVASSSRPGVTKKNFVYAMFTPRWLPAKPLPLPFMALRFRIGGSGPGQKRSRRAVTGNGTKLCAAGVHPAGLRL